MNEKLSNSDLNRLSVEDFKQQPKIPVCIILDNIRSLNNIGSVFRTADAFLIEKIYLCGITAKPPHREIQKTALGATESVNWEYCNNAVELAIDLKDRGYTIVAVEQTQQSVDLADLKINENCLLALVFGNEVQGISQALVNEAHICLEIPQYGTKHSLNISVSVGIVLWDIFKQLYPLKLKTH